MDSEVAAVIAEVNLRKQHKYRMGWDKADQRDENRWTRHDLQDHGMPYAICTVCEYLDALDKKRGE
jgi:hypothetical protein